MAAPFTLLWHVTLYATLHGQSIQNGFYFTNQVSLDDSLSALGPYTQGIADEFNAFILPPIKAFQNNEVHYRNIIVSTLIPHNGPIGEFIIETGEGAQPDESLPSYCAAILTLRTGLGGKSNRGRLYFAGVSENDTAAGRLLPDSLAALQNIGNVLLGYYGPTGSEGVLRYVVFSRLDGYTPETGYIPEGIKPISHTLARSALGTQRHRLIGKGP